MMANISDDQLKTILDRLPNEQRQTLADIITGAVTHNVYCMSPTCKGDLIAHIYKTDDPLRPSVRGTDERYLSFCVRIDGFWGFQCLCGNDSRQAPQETDELTLEHGLLEGEMLQALLSRVAANPSVYPKNGSIQEIDGFQIETLGA